MNLTCEVGNAFMLNHPLSESQFDYLIINCNILKEQIPISKKYIYISPDGMIFCGYIDSNIIDVFLKEDDRVIFIGYYLKDSKVIHINYTDKFTKYFISMNKNKLEKILPEKKFDKKKVKI